MTSPVASPEKVDKRFLAISEIVSTEVTYVQQLRDVIKFRLEPIAALCEKPKGQRLLSKKKCEALFSNIKDILNIHEPFLADLLERQKTWKKDDPKTLVIGDLFIKFVPWFKMYTPYVNNHCTANELMNQIFEGNNNKFDRFMEFERTVREASTSKLGIQSYLITPIQRIPRYRLLLQELLKHTPSDQPDYGKLQQALGVVIKVADHINEELRSSKNRLLLLQVVKQFAGQHNDLIAPDRVFIRKGELMRVCRGGTRPFTFYLFNDMLIYASKSGWKFRVHRRIPITLSFQVLDLPDVPAGEQAGKFRIKILSCQKTFILICLSAADKESWLKDILKVVNERKEIEGKLVTRLKAQHQAETAVAPLWQPDKEATNCRICQKPFSLLHRKHHCRNCGFIVCNACSKNKAKLSFAGDEMCRVCDTCYNALTSPAPKDSTPSTPRAGVSTPTRTDRIESQSQEASKEGGMLASPSKYPIPPRVPSERAEDQSGMATPVVPGDITRSAAPSVSISTSQTQPGTTIIPAKMAIPPIPARPASASAVGGPIKNVLLTDTVFNEISSGSAQPPKFPKEGGSMSPQSMDGSAVPPAHVPHLRVRGPSLISEPVSPTNLTQEWVYLPHKEHAYIPAMLYQQGEKESVYRTIDGEMVTCPNALASKFEAATMGVVDDVMENLVHLDDKCEGAMLHQLRLRYTRDLIYTNIGNILVSINPFKVLSAYTAETFARYRQQKPGEVLPPHLFAIAHDAYLGACDAKSLDQFIVISGESGAGKTEATKLVIQYISEVAGSESNIEQRLLQASPMLESFGNAKTVRNDNSSRYGKYMAIRLNQNHCVSGGSVVNYLLEKTRVVTQAPGERSYHIFYQLCAAASKDQGRFLGMYGLSAPENFNYLVSSGCYSIPNVNDLDDFKYTLNAMKKIGFEAQEITDTLMVLASILHLGNIEPQPVDEKISRVDPASLQTLCTLIGVSQEELTHALLFREFKVVGGDSSQIPLNANQAVVARDAMAKALYGVLFDWLVTRINESLAGSTPNPTPDQGCRTIGILDIFGFEIFETNSFEQFLINYANEKLQQLFNQHVFSLEQQLYQEEEVTVEHIDHIDNNACLDLIEKRSIPVGILCMLDESCKEPEAADSKLMIRMRQQFSSDLLIGSKSLSGINTQNINPCFVPNRTNPDMFRIRHYAGPVEYNIRGFIEKNRDRFEGSLAMCFGKSTVPLLKKLGQQLDPAVREQREKDEALARARAGIGKGTIGEGTKSSVVSTLGGKFQLQLADLVNVIRAANPHYIRCIKPNENKAAYMFNAPLVLRQLKNAGLFEALRIRKMGFPMRMKHAQFYQKYRLCMPGQWQAEAQRERDNSKGKGKGQSAGDNQPMSDAEKCRVLIDKLHDRCKDRLDVKGIVVGKTKVLWRSSVNILLEQLRQHRLVREAGKIQRCWRAMQKKKHPQAYDSPVSPPKPNLAELRAKSQEDDDPSKPQLINLNAATPFDISSPPTPVMSPEAGKEAPPLSPIEPASKEASGKPTGSSSPTNKDKDQSEGAGEYFPPSIFDRLGLGDDKKSGKKDEKKAGDKPHSIMQESPRASPRAKKADLERDEKKKKEEEEHKKKEEKEKKAREEKKNGSHGSPRKDEKQTSPRRDKDAKSEKKEEKKEAKKDAKPKSPPSISQHKTVPVSVRLAEAKAGEERKANPVLTDYELFLKSKGCIHVSQYPMCRSDKDYYHSFFSAKMREVHRLRWVFQKDSIPNPLTKVDSNLEKQALAAFSNILSYTKCKYHAYPATAGFEVVKQGFDEAGLRGEIYCQLIKQTSVGDEIKPDAESLILSWKLMYICLKAFWPPEDLRKIFLSHLAAHAQRKVPAQIDLDAKWPAKLDNFAVPDLATMCYAEFRKSEVKPAPTPKPKKATAEGEEDEDEESDSDDDDEPKEDETKRRLPTMDEVTTVTNAASSNVVALGQEFKTQLECLLKGVPVVAPTQHTGTVRRVVPPKPASISQNSAVVSPGSVHITNELKSRLVTSSMNHQSRPSNTEDIKELIKLRPVSMKGTLSRPVSINQERLNHEKSVSPSSPSLSSSPSSSSSAPTLSSVSEKPVSMALDKEKLQSHAGDKETIEGGGAVKQVQVAHGSEPITRPVSVSMPVSPGSHAPVSIAKRGSADEKVPLFCTQCGKKRTGAAQKFCVGCGRKFSS